MQEVLKMMECSILFPMTEPDDDGESATQFFISPPKQNTTPEHNASLDPNAGNIQLEVGGSNSGGFQILHMVGNREWV